MTAPLKEETESLRTGRDTRSAGGLWLSFSALTAFAVAGVVLVFLWISDERSRSLRAWQDKLTIVAESRAAAVGDWVAVQRDVIDSLGRDDIVRLYLSDIVSAGRDPEVDDVPAQTQYLANLLEVTAGRAGFSAPAVGPDVRANVDRVGRAGIAIVDSNLDTIVATSGLPPQTPDLRAFIAGRIGQTGSAMLGPFPADADGMPSMAFAAPVVGIQSETQAGVVVGIRPVGDALFALLKQPGAIEETAEAMLLITDAAAVRYVSPLRDGTPALDRTRALDTPGLAAAFAIQNPGGFGVFRDYREAEVLVASRQVPGTDWILAYKVDRAEALGATDRRLTRMLVILLLAVAVAAAGIIAAWRHGASRRAAEAAERYRELAVRYEAQAKFIRKLTDTQPNAIMIVDADDRVTFANARLADLVGVQDTDELMGKTLAGVFGPAAARRYARGVREAFAEEASVTRIDRIPVGDGEGHGNEQVLQAQFVHLPATGHASAGVLIVEQDITEAISQRERNERLLEQLSGTLLAIVDRRDTYAAHQSARVAEVACALAEEMSLDEVYVDTVDKSARLMNIGKVLVPRQILMKTGALTDDEAEKVRRSLAAGIELLADVEFAGPVVETLRQTRAHFDGTGDPRGLAGDDILITARVVAVANAFVGMVSPRAHRPGMAFDETVSMLLDMAGSRFDLAVVGALINRLENRGGREAWSGFSNPPPGIHGMVG